MTGVVEALLAAGVRRAEAGVPMSRHTSWRTGGPADYLCVVEEERQLQAAVAVALGHGLPWLVLGGGNNILVADDGIEGLVILNRLRGIHIEPEVPQVVCGAGVFFAKVAQFTAREGYTGMEWGISIPGTVGAGVVNNAGAHWLDSERALISADVIDSAGRRETLTPAALDYRYRGSALKMSVITQTQSVVTTCRFRIAPGDAEAALAHIEELRRHRMETQPIKEASAGSTFKNPPGHAAGALIDSVGLKGHCIGDAQISPLHANFVVNLGCATAADILGLIRLAQDRVRESTGVRLEPEVQFVGRWPAALLGTVLEAA
jgi:UDP-N-acetylmuramate dehydrogenase